MTRSRAILAATSIAAAAALLVAGCDDDPPATPSHEPTTASESPSESPSPSASAVVVAPERPKAMDDDGPAGAEAAAVYFQTLDSYMMKTGDTATWEAMSQQSCETCAGRLDQAREIAQNNDVFSGGEATVSVLHTYEQDAVTGIWPIDLRIRTKPATITNSSGAEVASFKASDYTARAEVALSGGKWVIVGIYDLDEE